MQGFLDHVDAAYASTSDGFFAHTDDLKLSVADPEGRRITGHWGYGSPHDSEPLVINARPVGGRNAGAFHGWVTISRAEHRRITAPRPAGWHSYTCMIGYAPDDETIWWSAVYDDDALASADFQEMDEGRWLRLPPGLAEKALVAKVEMLQQSLDLVPEPEPPAPATRESVYTTIMDGIGLCMDADAVKHLTGSQASAIKRAMLEAVVYLDDKWIATRHRQSLSGATSASRRR